MNFLKLKIKNLKLGGGFTLIEMLIATFTFAIIMVVVSGSFINALRLGRQAQNIQQVQENSSFILELIAREIRVSDIQNSSLSSSCPSTNPVVTLCLEHPVNGTIEYFLSGTQVHRRVNGTDTILSSNKIEFTRMEFYLSGATIGDGLQPRATIIASVRSIGANDQAQINTQTTVSQRLLSN